MLHIQLRHVDFRLTACLFDPPVCVRAKKNHAAALRKALFLKVLRLQSDFSSTQGL
jgi:hypothetical protein